MKKITYFSVSLLAVIGLLLSSCQPQVVVEEKVVIQEKEVIKEVEVEVEKEVVKEVEKPVTEYVEVEKIVEVEKAGAAETGNEGPYPVQYVNAEAAGVTIDSYSGNPLFSDLPPVADRLPTEPAVVLNLDTIGSYGGELAGPTTNPSCCGWDVLEMRLQRLLMIDTDLSTPIPNIAKGWEVSDDNTTFTFHLREGHKFSDGQPFTCRDFEFYHNDVLANTELTAAPAGTWTAGGELVDFKCVDETTVQYTFAEAKPTFLLALAAEVGNRGFRPAHYFEQMHIDYNADANKQAEDAGYENWVQMFNAHMSPYNFTWNLGSEIDPGAPTLNTHVFDSEDDFGNKLYTANPYFFKVDTAGNQLPYTDSLRRILVEDLEVQDLKAIAGEYTHFGWGKLTSYPTYRANEEAGGYRTALATYNRGNEYSFIFNLTHPDPYLKELFNDIRWRQAMSMAINRDEINELVYFGLATASQAAPTPDSTFFEDWMADYYANYDVDAANALLDELGLDQRDADGYRLRSTGEPLFINYQASVPEEAWLKIAELVTSYWQAVGVNVQFKLIEIGLYSELRNQGEHDVASWGLDIVDIGEYSNGANNLRPNWGARAGAVQWQKWFNTDGAEGEEPPEDVKKMNEAFDKWGKSAFGSDDYKKYGKEAYELSFKGLYQIGTIQLPPQPLLFASDLMNTPPNNTTGKWSWSYRQWQMFMPETWYFATE